MNEDFDLALGTLIERHKAESTSALLDALDHYVQMLEQRQEKEGREASADAPEPHS